MSLDGYVAGPNQSVSAPLGEGGEALHEWALALEAWRATHGRDGGEVNASTAVMEGSLEGIGATIMGRRMFGGGPGPWAEPAWEGWWGDEPPFGHPVFVLTHHARPPLVKGSTTFTFVTDGIEAALDAARAAAGGGDVALSGGADVVNQYLAAGLVDELLISVAPVLLGDGERLFANGAGAGTGLEQVEAVEAPGVTHLLYRARR